MQCRMEHQFLSMQGHNSRSNHEIINHVLLGMLSRFQWLLTQFIIHSGPMISCCDSWGLLEPRWTRTHVWTYMSYLLLQNFSWIQPTIQSCFPKLWQSVDTFNLYQIFGTLEHTVAWENYVVAWYGPADSLTDTFTVLTDFSLSYHVRYIEI